MKELGLKHKINDVQDLANKLNQRAAKAALTNPTAPVVEFLVFEPPSKSTLFSKTLSGEVMRSKHMNCQSTLAVTSAIRKNGDIYINDHKLYGQPIQHCCKTVLIDRNKGEKDHEGDVDAGTGEPAADGWRRSYRKLEPEKEDHNLDKLSGQFAGIATQRLRDSLALSGRSKTKDHAAATLRQQQVRKRAADAAVRQRVAQEQAASSSSSSSNSGSASSSSSSSSSASGN